MDGLLQRARRFAEALLRHLLSWQERRSRRPAPVMRTSGEPAGSPHHALKSVDADHPPVPSQAPAATLAVLEVPVGENGDAVAPAGDIAPVDNGIAAPMKPLAQDEWPRHTWEDTEDFSVHVTMAEDPDQEQAPPKETCSSLLRHSSGNEVEGPAIDPALSGATATIAHDTETSNTMETAGVPLGDSLPDETTQQQELLADIVNEGALPANLDQHVEPEIGAAVVDAPSEPGLSGADVTGSPGGDYAHEHHGLDESPESHLTDPGPTALESSTIADDFAADTGIGENHVEPIADTVADDTDDDGVAVESESEMVEEEPRNYGVQSDYVKVEEERVADQQPAVGGRSKAPVYRPRLQRSRVRKAASGGGVAPPASEFQDLEADLQLFFGPGDWGIEMGALLPLPAGAEEVAVMDGGDETWLGALDDQLLESLPLPDAALVLDEGLSIEAVDLPVRWRRSLRDLHVFGQHATVAGFISRPRVAIGEENAVICRVGLAQEALAQILETGSAQPIRVEGPGVPEGWVCWRGIRPARPSAPVPGRPILDALDPLPAVTIEFGGGLQLVRGRWLLGHPPAIRLLGLVEPGEPVIIDGRVAAAGLNGDYCAEGWDGAGRHRVEHGGLSATYQIDPGAASWDWWPAHQAATAIAGALASADGGEYFHGAPSACLLGARAGEISGFVSAAVGIYVARPDFAPVWMVTGCAGVRRAKASLVGEPLAPAAPTGAGPAAIGRWARSLCSAGCAGAPGTAERRLWDRYVAVAHTRRWRKR